MNDNYQANFQQRLQEITDKVVPEICEFYSYLEKYPYMGAQHEIGKKIIAEVQNAPRIDIRDSCWYRGRPVHDSHILNAQEMLPPDPEKVAIGEGRFNHYGQSHFYLSQSKKLCFKEINQMSNAICWIQEFYIRKIENIIDLSFYLNSSNIDSVPLVFGGIMSSGAIRRPVRKDKCWKPEYFVPRFIADACKANGINGILYNSAVDYGCNLVIFNMEKLDFCFAGIPEIFRFPEY
jgi:hypothetical protein